MALYPMNDECRSIFSEEHNQEIHGLDQEIESDDDNDSQDEGRPYSKSFKD